MATTIERQAARKAAGSRRAVATSDLKVTQAKVRAVLDPKGSKRGKLDFGKVYRLDGLQYIEAVRSGFPAQQLPMLADKVGRRKEYLYEILRLPRTTVERKAKAGKNLDEGASERVLGLTRLIGLVDAMVRESGHPEGFDAAVWLCDWLDTPLPALGGAKPSSLMDTIHGQQLVADSLERIRQGVFA